MSAVGRIAVASLFVAVMVACRDNGGPQNGTVGGGGRVTPGGGGGEAGEAGAAGAGGDTTVGSGGEAGIASGNAGSSAAGSGGAVAGANGGALAGGNGGPGGGGAAGSGRGGAAADGGGRSGAAGTGGRGGMGGGAGRAITGAIVECPASAPSGACTVESLSCAYATKSCVCDGGAWKCLDCPATRPATGDDFTTSDLRIWMACRYGDVTCSYPATSSLGEYSSTSWVCGICPSTRPVVGDPCGNTRYECSYGADTCQCGDAGKWTCATPECAPTVRSASDSSCTEPGHFTCRYAELDETCLCGTIRHTRRCTCPATRPANGTACLGFTSVGGGLSDCKYGETSCACGATGWSCSTPVCPAAQPANGGACATPVSCSYGATICACDGASWSCS